MATTNKRVEAEAGKGRYGLHLINEPGKSTVWLNTELSDFDGLCIGMGVNEAEALLDAVTALEALTEAIQGGDLSVAPSTKD